MVQRALFGPEDSKWLWKTDKDGQTYNTQLLVDVEEVVEHWELGQPLGSLTHSCWVEEGSRDHFELNKRPGGPCCASRDEAVDKARRTSQRTPRGHPGSHQRTPEHQQGTPEDTQTTREQPEDTQRTTR